MIRRRVRMLVGILLSVGVVGTADDAVPEFERDIRPILERRCVGCHRPGKLKGGLDLTRWESLGRGGDSGPVVVSGDADASLLVTMTRGPDPEMPPEGERLTADEAGRIEAWVLSGAPRGGAAAAPDDSLGFVVPDRYPVAPALSAMAYSPDGRSLAVSGYGEVLVLGAADGGIRKRLPAGLPRVEGLAFAGDGHLLAAAVGDPGRAGAIRIWRMPDGELTGFFPVATDSLAGLSFSPEGARVAVGGVDRAVRVLRVRDGGELLRLDNHREWVVGTAFSADGRRLVSASRDRALKLVDLPTGRLVDDVNRHIEPILCLARHPAGDRVAYGGDAGGVRVYRMSANEDRSMENRDSNLILELEGQGAPVTAVGFSSDGDRLAVGLMSGWVRVYSAADGRRLADLGGHEGPVYSVVFHPVDGRLATGGREGWVRVFDVSQGALVVRFLPFPMSDGFAAGEGR